MIYEAYINGNEKVVTDDVHEILRRIKSEQVARIFVWTNNGQRSHRYELKVILDDEGAAE